MHGVGYPFASRALKAFGLPEAIPVTEQVQPDPTFPTVPFPNPEEHGALNLAIETATKQNVNLVLANDPDADRFAVAERQPNGEWFTFTGDQIGSILAATIVENAKQDGIPVSELTMVNSSVSSRMLKVIADTEGLRYHETLTGFKWMGNKIEEVMLEKKAGDPNVAVTSRYFAYEEAIGYMVNPEVLDKDGVTALVMFVEMAARQLKNGKTMKEYLDALYAKYGFHASSNYYFICRSPEKIAKIFSKIRYGSDAPSSFPRTNFKCESDGVR
jgi:phosphoglucomutase